MPDKNAPFLYPTLDGLDVQGKRVLVRVDYNIADNDDGELIDDWRIRATLPTLIRLRDAGARIGILTHRGRPQGRVVPALSTKPLAERLSRLIGQEVEYIPDCIGRVAEKAMADLAPGKIVLFENTRYHLAEQLNQMSFVKKLAALGDIFVNDAFGTAHRAHASTSGLAATMPVSVIGDLMIKELTWLHRITSTPDRPLVLIVGGIDVAPRLELISKLMTRVDTLMLGGTLGLTFLAARDVKTGQSRIENSCVAACRDLLAEAGVVGCRIHLPKDFVVAHKERPELPDAVRDAYSLMPDDVASDIGPETLAIWKKVIAAAGTVVWVGSLGTLEIPVFRKGGMELAQTILESECHSLIGGNAIVMSLRDNNLRDQFEAISTGVGSLLAGLMLQPLPPLTVLRLIKNGDVGERRRERTIT